MLPPFIIEEIRKREELQKRDERPVLELPLVDPSLYEPSVYEPGAYDSGGGVAPHEESDVPRRGIIVVDL